MTVYGSYEVGFENPNSTWARAAAMVRPGSVVLDVGCSAGQLAAALRREKGCVVDGVEMDERDASSARDRCREVWQGDIIELAPKIETRYEHILMLDVLEHLVDPGKGLAAVAELLEPEGSAILSVPNMAHAAIRLQLLQGHFPMEDEGLLDRTHLRFFDEHTIRELIDGSPLMLESLDRIVFDVQAEFVAAALGAVGLKPTETFSQLIHSREASTYQFVMRLRHRKPGQASVQVREEYLAPLHQYWEALQQTQSRLLDTESRLQQRIADSVLVPSRLRGLRRLMRRWRSL